MWFVHTGQFHNEQLLTDVDANQPFRGSQPRLMTKRLWNAAIFLTTKKPPVLRAGYGVDFIVYFWFRGLATPFAEHGFWNNVQFLKLFNCTHSNVNKLNTHH